MPPGSPIGQRALTVAAASGLATLGAVPVFLLGALAVLLRDELDLSPQRLGFAVALFFAVAALGSLPAGRIADRFGARTALQTGVGVTAAGLAGMAAARDWRQLSLALGVAGFGHAMIQLAGNLLLSHAVPARTQGLAFGIKQSAVPMASLVAGVAVPVLALTAGWRWTCAAAAAVAATCAVLRLPGTGRAGRHERDGSAPRLPRRELTVLAIGAGLGASAANATGAFLVTFVTETGLPAGRAGVLLAAVSLAGVTVRVGVGYLADVRPVVDLRGVSVMLTVGTLALIGLARAESESAMLWAASALAFAAGWGWPGLLTFLVAKRNPAAPAAATGITQAGIFTGAVIGPLFFGLAVSAMSFRAAWTAAAAAQFVAAFLVLLTHRAMKQAEPAAGRGAGRPLDGAPSPAGHGGAPLP